MSVLQGDPRSPPFPSSAGSSGSKRSYLSSIYFLTGSSLTAVHVSHGLASERARSLSACFRSQAGYQTFGHAFMKWNFSALSQLWGNATILIHAVFTELIGGSLCWFSCSSGACWYAAMVNSDPLT